MFIKHLIRITKISKFWGRKHKMKKYKIKENLLLAQRPKFKNRIFFILPSLPPRLKEIKRIYHQAVLSYKQAILIIKLMKNHILLLQTLKNNKNSFLLPPPLNLMYRSFNLINKSNNHQHSNRR